MLTRLRIWGALILHLFGDISLSRTRLGCSSFTRRKQRLNYLHLSSSCAYRWLEQPLTGTLSLRHIPVTRTFSSSSSLWDIIATSFWMIPPQSSDFVLMMTEIQIGTAYLDDLLNLPDSLFSFTEPIHRNSSRILSAISPSLFRIFP